MTKFVFAGILVLMLIPLVSLSGAQPVIYGPEAFQRTTGSTDVYDENFSAVPGPAFLVLFNGDDEQDSRVSSGSVVLNGVEVVSQNELNQQVDRLLKPVLLSASEALQVTLNGQPGGYITLLIVNDRKILPEFTAGRIQLAWTSIADPSRTVMLRLKNGSPCFNRSFTVRYFMEDGSLAAVSAEQQLAAHASIHVPAQSFLPAGAAWQTGSIEILFAGLGGGRILGFGVESNSSAQTETDIPLQWGGIRHYFNPVKKK